MRKTLVVLVVCLVLLTGGAAVLYRFALPGFSSARPDPSGVEVALATWLLRHSVPEDARTRRSAWRRCRRYRCRARPVPGEMRSLPRL